MLPFQSFLEAFEDNWADLLAGELENFDAVADILRSPSAVEAENLLGQSPVVVGIQLAPLAVVVGIQLVPLVVVEEDRIQVENSLVDFDS